MSQRDSGEVTNADLVGLEGKIDLLDQKIDHVLELLSTRYADLDRRVTSLESTQAWIVKTVVGLIIVALVTGLFVA